MAGTKKDRLTALQSAVKKYVEATKKRYEDEVKMLKDIQTARLGGKGLESRVVSGTVTAAEAALADYLEEK